MNDVIVLSRLCSCVTSYSSLTTRSNRLTPSLCLSLFSKLALRAVNPSHSAYSCFLFSPLFFQQYKVGSGPSSVPIKCKLSMKVFSHLGTVAIEEANVLILPIMCPFVCKSVLPLFRCLTSIERSVEQCQLSVSSSLSDRVLVQFFCRHGTVSVPIINTWRQCFLTITS